MPALKGLGIFSNRELDLFQVYHYILLMVLPVIKLFWNIVALFFIFAPELDLLHAQVTQGKEKNNHSSSQSNVGSVLPITWDMATSYTGFLSPCLLCDLKLIVSPLPAHPQGFLFSSLSSAHGSAPLPEDEAALTQTITLARKGWCKCETVLDTAFLQWN